MFKPCLDMLAALLGLVILSPGLMLVALLIKIDSPGSVFFCQERVGQNFKPFRLYKFRSMREDAPLLGPGLTSRGDVRITRLGRFLRSTKIDELPQLWNVLRGDIALVGPRPEIARYVEKFRADYTGILMIKPGITDYAAVEFRYEEKILAGYQDQEAGYIQEVLPAKIVLYKKYIAEISFWTDIKILFLTLFKHWNLGTINWDAQNNKEH